MINYKKKYLKYLSKSQYGGVRTIVYSDEILKFIGGLVRPDDFENMKECIYSCIYMNMTTMMGACSPSATNVKCSVLNRMTFPFYTSSGYDIAAYTIIKDDINNNLVVVFDAGSIFYCDHIPAQLFHLFCHMYKVIQSMLIEHGLKFVHIVGHSMGGSLSILFSYFIMIVERSTIGNIYEPSQKYLSVDYELNITYDLSTWNDVFNEYFSAMGYSVNIFEHFNESNLALSEFYLDTLFENEYPKIADKISICCVGPFPVLFRSSDKSLFDDYISFYRNRYVVFGNCGESTDEEYAKNMSCYTGTIIPPNINDIFCDYKPFNISFFKLDGEPITDLSIFNYYNINDLSVMNTIGTSNKSVYVYKDKQVVNLNTIMCSYGEKTVVEKASDQLSSILHLYKYNYNKLKRYVQVPLKTD